VAVPYVILDKLRVGQPLTEAEVLEVVSGATDGSWSDGQLSAFLMAVAIRGLDSTGSSALTQGMLESGDQWDLKADFPTLCDKHSTGGVGDKVSLILAPLLAACDVPVVMLTGRGLGHTGGTADKLDTIPGLDQGLDRQRTVSLLKRHGLAVGIATGEIAPADRRLYGLRNSTGTVESIPLIAASIASKKLASGAANVVFDIKTGNGSFLPEFERARELARVLVESCEALGTRASAVLTDMSQPLGRWVGHHAEVYESRDCLQGDGPADLMEVVYALCVEVAQLAGFSTTRADLERAIANGSAYESFERWLDAQGGRPVWQDASPLAPVERVVKASRSGRLSAVDNRRLGLLMVAAGAGRTTPEQPIDYEVSLRYDARLGQELSAGDDIARLYLRSEDPAIVASFEECFTIDEDGTAPELVGEVISARSIAEARGESG